MLNIIEINPTLDENIPIVVALMRSQYSKDVSGYLTAYDTYTLISDTQEKRHYFLTHPVFQFIADHTAPPHIPKTRLDIVDPLIEAEGGFGSVLSVVKSIIFKDDTPVFDTLGTYVVKEIRADQNALPDKPNKPNWNVRAVRREHRIASQMPCLMAHYQLIETEQLSYLHMNRAPGKTLDQLGPLNATQFLSLACALLEEVPKQIKHPQYKGQPIVHCDLKPHNVMALFDNNKWTITVLDMGLAKALKNGKYVAPERHGNLLGMDKDMVNDLIIKEEIIYDSQSDLYALFVIIARLAGAQTPQVTDIMLYLSYLTHVSLKGLFNDIDLDPSVKEPLELLINKMLNPDRSQRATHHEALSGFKDALNILLLKKTTDAPSKKLSEPPEYIAIDIINWVKELGITEKNLHYWIKKFRKLVSSCSEQEFDIFLRKNQEGLSITNPHIINFLRFNFMTPYDANTAARLLVRHHTITSSPELLPLLTPKWICFFLNLRHNLPLQSSSASAELFSNLAKFSKKVNVIVNLKSNEPIENLWTSLKTKLSAQLEMEPKQWISQAPEFITAFNKQYGYYDQINTSITQIQELLELKESIQQPLIDRLKDIAAIVCTENYSHIVEKHLKLLADLVRHLKDFYFYKYRLHRMQSSTAVTPLELSYEHINELINNLDLKDNSKIVDLVEKLELKMLIIKSNDYLKYLHRHPLINDIKKHFLNLFDPSLSYMELKIKLETMIDYLRALESLDQFGKQIKDYRQIEQALNKVIKDQNCTIEMDKMISFSGLLGKGFKLNAGLKALASRKEDTPANILFEFTRFYASPTRYRPRTESQAKNSNSLFNSPSCITNKQLLDVATTASIRVLNE